MQKGGRERPNRGFVRSGWSALHGPVRCCFSWRRRPLGQRHRRRSASTEGVGLACSLVSSQKNLILQTYLHSGSLIHVKHPFLFQPSTGKWRKARCERVAAVLTWSLLRYGLLPCLGFCTAVLVPLHGGVFEMRPMSRVTISCRSSSFFYLRCQCGIFLTICVSRNRR